ncbi:MAG: ubiquinone/menaquinone biosynthesis methyltransferase [Candidatus Micrarchaeia archaeon]
MSQKINKIFSRISNRYDSMNHILSFGIDKSWRDEAVRISCSFLKDNKNPRILDVATGTGDLAILLSKKIKNAKITAIDFNSDMVKIGEEKAIKNQCKNITFLVSDALKTNFKPNSFDLCISGFALRNLDDLDIFLKEQKRILTDNGHFVYLDMALPDEKLNRIFFKIYSHFMLFVGFFVDYTAYYWLTLSIKKFDKKNLIELLTKNNFKNIKYKELSTKIAYIVNGNK